jgi:hypothetical protein
MKKLNIFQIITFVAITANLSKPVNAQNVKHPLFTGGMFLHVGYLSNDRSEAKIDGITKGLGGKLVFYTGKHIRIGTEGYSSTFNYPSEKGFYKLGWGGAVVEFYKEIGSWAFVGGATAGRGGTKDLYLKDANIYDREPDDAIYEKQSFWVFTPSISSEYLLSEKIRLVIKADYILAPGVGIEKMTASGPKLYVGILFSH